ncbi:hypothetical protein [Plantibacter flavus]|uniref:hypothetical protein n=1 Tax=Plantibacter flavus TaxID=150123 RepID=UPI0012946769|nr:hypothetical protein [Plantibacter flavus]
MSEIQKLPDGISDAITLEALRLQVSPAGDDVDRLLAELEVKVAIRNGIRASEQETVDELRKRDVPWSDIADRSGHSSGQYALMAYTPKAPKPAAKRGDALPGYSRTEAAAITGLHPKTIRTLLERHSGESWLIEVESSDKRAGRTRILDLDKLVASSGRTPKKAD